MDLSAEEFRQKILTAFADVEAPDPNDIAEPSDWDAGDITSDFKPCLSGTVLPEILEAHAKSLPALTPRAFVFFIKHYLLYSLEQLGSELTEHTIYRALQRRERKPLLDRETVAFLTGTARGNSYVLRFPQEAAEFGGESASRAT